jgi:hypothetical protein
MWRSRRSTRWLNDGLDPAVLAANVIRHAEVADGKAHGDCHRITGLEYRLFSLRFHHVQAPY